MTDSGQDGKDSTRELTKSLVKADKVMQLAFMLPTAVLVGWLIGAGLDLWLHRHWIYLVGISLGIVAGFVQIFRLMKEMTGEIDGGKTKSANRDGNLKADTKTAQDDRIRQEPK